MGGDRLGHVKGSWCRRNSDEGVYGPHAVRGYFSSTVLKGALTGLTRPLTTFSSVSGIGRMTFGWWLCEHASFLAQAHVLLFTTALLLVDAISFTLSTLLGSSALERLLTGERSQGRGNECSCNRKPDVSERKAEPDPSPPPHSGSGMWG